MLLPRPRNDRLPHFAVSYTPLSHSKLEMAIVLLFFVSAASLIGCSHESLFPEKRGMMEKREVCQSKECEERARKILSFVNQEASPCEDFYEYTCGKYLQSRTEESVDDEYVKMRSETRKALREIVLKYPNITEARNFTEKVIMMHQACMYSNLTEEQETEAVKEILTTEGYGSWPLLGNKEMAKKQFPSLKDLLLATSILHLFKVYHEADIFFRTSKNIWVNPGRQTLSHFILNISANSTNSTRNKNALEEVLMATARRFRPNASNEDLMALAQDAIRIQAKLDKISQRDSRLGRIMLNSTEQHFPSFPVYDLLNNFLSGVNYTLRYDDKIIFGELEALNETWQFLQSQDVNSVYNYVGLHIAAKMLHLSSRTHREETACIYKEHEINTPEYSRAEECYGIVTKVPTVLTRLYVLKKFDFAAKVAARFLLNSIGREYYRNLILNPWMDRRTRLAAIKKLKQMKPVVGYSDTLMDETALESSFHLLKNIKRNSSVSTMVYWLEKNLVEINLFKAKGITPFIYEEDYQSANAYYFSMENKMVIPAGVLRGILFNTFLPRYLNLGALGFVVGHEMTHGFYKQGSEYDGRGKLSNWWTNYTREKFEERESCITRQYSMIVEPVTNKTLNGKRVISEAISDQGGIGIAFKTYLELEQKITDVALPGLENFTSEQLFFISFAMPFCSRQTKVDISNLIGFAKHALDKYRVNVSLKNMEQFSAAFHCKKGSAMRLPDHERCILW